MSKKIGILNYLKDLFKYDIHRKIRKKIHSYSKSKKDLTYDYSGGYFYQSSERINLSGLRSSKKRTLNYSINEILKNKDILDVGTNSGFLLFELENNFKSILGIDYNQKLINLANIVKDYLDEKKIFFICADFETHKFDKKFDVIFSLANHSTYDEGIKSTEKYLSKCNYLLEEDGHLLIESHHPGYEKISDFDKIINRFVKEYNYTIIKKSILKTGFFYDDGRKFYILRKNV